MKRYLVITLLGIGFAMAGCSYRIVVFQPKTASMPEPDCASTPYRSGHPSVGQPFKYDSPKTHRDSLLFELEKASREAARTAWEATKHKCPGYSKYKTQ